MTTSTKVDFLFQIFTQSLMDLQFYTNAKKCGVNFKNFPDNFMFDVCKQFAIDELAKSYQYARFSALNKLKEINKDTGSKFDKAISLDEVKIFYGDYLTHLKTQELVTKLIQQPERGIELCNNFLNNKNSLVNYLNIQDAVELFVKETEVKIKSQNFGVMLKGFENLSKTIDGFNPGRVTIITAPTGFGKTNLAMNLFTSALSTGLNSVFINMEMDTHDLTKRFLQSQYKMTQDEFKQESYVSKIAQNTKPWLEKGQTSYFTDGTSLSLYEIDSLVMDIIKKHKVDIIFCDYDQQIVDDSNYKDEEWRFILKAVSKLEALAKRENIHIVLFSQTDEEKNGVPRASKRAMQPASAVLYLHKEEGKTLIKFIKNRFGPTDKRLELNYEPSKSYISEKGFYIEQSKPTNNRERVMGTLNSRTDSRGY